jgi:NhaP-type Na+/H+ or K+/H+ antiporter
MEINVILSLAAMFFAGAVGIFLVKATNLPRITLYIIMGLFIGPEILNFISPKIIVSSSLITNIALSFIAFELGQSFSVDKLRSVGKSMIVITVFQMVVTLLLVTGAIYFMGKSMAEAFLVGAIATATAPAAVVMVIKEYKARGKFTDTLLGVVTLDDGGGIIIFAVILSIIKGINSATGSVGMAVLGGIGVAFTEIAGAIFLGIFLGWVLYNVLDRMDKSMTPLIVILAFILLNTGISLHFHFSILMANMSMGMFMENRKKIEERFFSSLVDFESPFYLLFFILAGAELRFSAFRGIALIGAVYIIARFAGKIIGTYMGAASSNADKPVRRYMGLALAPQAGVALGFALIVKSTFPGAMGNEIFSVILASTIIFEIGGPVLTQYALKKSGDIGRGH